MTDRGTGERLAGVIAAIGRQEFANRLLEAAQSRIAHDAAALMVFDPLRPPAVLVDHLQPAERGHLYGDYLSGVYRLSPFFRAAQKLKAPLAARIGEIAPHGFSQSEYHRRYFSLIGVEDMLGLLLPLDGMRCGFMSFSRSTGKQKFSTGDVRTCSEMLAALAAAARRHEDLAGPLDARAKLPAAKPSNPPVNGLTAREREVMNLMLEGHSARSIGVTLDISHETIRVHRRHIYEKLGVSSQAGLFHWFLSARA